MKHSELEKDLFKLYEKYAKIVAKQFKMPMKKIKLFAHNDPAKDDAYGYCDIEQGIIHINIRLNNTMFDSVENVMDTIVHEIAHLKFDHHGRDFWALHAKMKEWLFVNYVNYGAKK